MELQELQYLLKKYHLSPNKVRGQNFLVSDDVLDNIIEAASIDAEDFVLEVGPGLGSLTTRLVTKAKKVFAFEVDKNLTPVLDDLQKVNKNLEVIWQDILSLPEEQWQSILQDNKVSNYKIVANIPYYLTNKFIQKFLSFKIPPKSMTLMIQKEVADRIVVKDKKNSLLSLAVDFYASSRIATYVGKENFYPIPKVDSAVIHIFDIKFWQYDVDEKKTWQLIRRGFASKRKKLSNNLLTDPKIKKEDITQAFEKLGIESNIRAEKLITKQWLELAKSLKI